MTTLERLADLRTNLDHVEALLRDQALDEAALRSDRSLHNDVLFSLLMICQAVIDVAGDLAGRTLAKIEGFSPELVHALEPLPGFRNVVIHEYTEVDYARVTDALGQLGAVREFLRVAVATLEVASD